MSFARDFTAFILPANLAAAAVAADIDETFGAAVRSLASDVVMPP